MLIIDDRTPLTEALADANTTVLVLAGATDGAVGAIHALIESRPDIEPWRRWFLVADLAVLTGSQRAAWFGDGEAHYVVLGGSVPKQVGSRGGVGDLLRGNGKPSILRIRRAFAQGDQL